MVALSIVIGTVIDLLRLPLVLQAGDARVDVGELRGASSGTSMIIEIRVAMLTGCLCNNTER